ncbi:MAG TPA: hypothetical protein DDW76_34375 [Cyanobacteria bacterium UBA11369]|nr:hypothetical protein [Cyanobacteria bacterium UBA11371]HBE31925.1 hypothetical protein [Cyanobacteria bacterium UBA11368]HBE53702.1 hypothetical protein [Cyanobacteria bacterium UBA11369]
MNKYTTPVADSLTSRQPYAIVAVFPGRKPKGVGRTRNRSDAEDMARFLGIKIPKGAFYVIFDPEEIYTQMATT